MVEPNSSADELSPRRGHRERRASGIGECVRVPATNEHLSKGAGDVSGEAPPMLNYHELPLIPYVLMQLVQTFIKGNPSSHKGWMSRFFYVKCDVMRDPWRCEMHWRDSAVTLVPRTPDRAPSLTPFLEAMHGKSYNAPELIREDLLCFYKFSRKGFELVGDLDERMGKAELLRAMQEAAAAPPKKSTKRKAPSMVEKEARGEKRKKAGASISGARTEEASKPKQAPTPPTPSSEEPLDVPPVSAIAGASSSGKGPERPLPFDPSKDSLVESPSAIVATGYICNMAPDRDRRPLRKARNADVVGHFSTNLAAKSYANLPVRNRAYVPSWSGFCVEELREFASAELGLCAELVGLLRRRATRICQCGTGLMCRAGRAYVLSSGRHPRSSIIDTMS
ncbi:hypothetical protein F511_35090 [Dorcoceras hygrometricum]|uniref:Uncharacterized protein n=1 Tax=Dorcoceras hygrometricum TaxID=472368 RepID=A0A2Z7CSX7_9LAMI|nr:hypothetical protein F511_35090 [Dorcoceras hygrometricum]